jgi:putative ABC transport system permease protein
MITDLRLATRAIIRSRWATLLQLSTIAIGVGGLSAVFAVVGAVVLRPLPFEKPGELVTIDVTSSRGFSISTSMPNYRDWRDRNQTLAAYGGYTGWTFRLARSGETKIMDGAAAYGDLFGVLRVRPALGRVFQPTETEPGSPPLVMLSHSTWTTQFGADSAIVGSSISLDGMPYTVTGVLPSNFAFPRREPPLIVNMGSIPDLPWDNRVSSFGTRVFARVKPGTSVAAAARDIEQVGLAVKQDNGPLTALPKVRSLPEYLLGEADQQLWLLLGAVGIVMLIAIGNAGGLVLARAADRRRDAAVRLALGGERADLRRQFIWETVVLMVAGGALGLMLAAGLVRALVPMLPSDLPQSLLDRIAIDPQTVVATLAICGVCGVLFGLMAARHAATSRLLETLRSGGQSIVAPKTRARSLILVGETALSVILAVGAGLLLTSFMRLRATDKGFSEEGLLMARVEASAANASSRDPWLNHFTTVLDRARALPGVTDVSASLLLPLTDRSYELRIQPFGATEAIEAGPSVLFNMVSEGYFSTLGVPLLRGRAFTETDRNDAAPVAIIDETMAERFWPGQDPIGQRVTIEERGADSAVVYRTVVGVTKNVRHYTLREPSRIQVYIPLRQTLTRYGQSLYVVVKTSASPGSLVSPLRSLTASVDPASASWDIHPVSFYLDQSISGERTLGVITIWLAVVASLVTAVGLFGLVTYAVVQRRREIALRLALGARPGEVVRLITWSGARMGVAGISIGILGAIVLSRFIEAFLYDVQPVEPSIYAWCAVGVFAVTGLASLLPALASRRLTPASVLRED